MAAICIYTAKRGTRPNRKPETSGMLRLCEDLDVRVLAYSPLAQGLLTGKYSKDFVPRWVRVKEVHECRGADRSMDVYRCVHYGWLTAAARAELARAAAFELLVLFLFLASAL